MPENRTRSLKKLLLDRKRKMWNDLRDELFRKLGKEYNEQFDIPQGIEEARWRHIRRLRGVRRTH